MIWFIPIELLSAVNILATTLFPLNTPPLGDAVSVSGWSPVQNNEEDVIDILFPFNRLTVRKLVSPGQFIEPPIIYLYIPPVSIAGSKILLTKSPELLIQKPLLSGWLFNPLIRSKGGSVLHGLIVLLSPANPPPANGLDSPPM